MTTAARPVRRSTPALLGAVALLASAASLLGLNILGDRYHTRADVTGTQEQSLSPRTHQILARLDGPCRVVVACDYHATDTRARQRVADVLEEMRRTSPRITYSFIDTGSAGGLDVYKRVVAELIDRERDTLATQASAIELAAGGAASFGTYLGDTLSPALLQIKQMAPPGADPARDTRAALDQMAGAARVTGHDLADAAGRARDALKSRLGEVPLPATDAASGELARALAPAVDTLGAIAKALERLAAAKDGPAADEAGRLAPSLRERRDQAAVVLDSLQRLKRPDVLRVTDVLSRGSAALVIGPPGKGLSAIDVDTLLPPGTLLDASNAGRADLQRRAEELVSSALGTLLSPNRPIIVLTHAESAELLESTAALQALAQRVRLHGLDLVEWSVLQSDRPTRLTPLNPDGSRPVVYVTWSPDSAAGADRSGLTGVQRATKLAEAITRLTNEGQGVLISVSQSVVPTFGDTDPIAPILARFGLAADSGRPILRELSTPKGRQVDTDAVAQPAEGAGTLAGAVRGLPALFPWGVAIVDRPDPPQTRITRTPIYAVAASNSVWAESQWLRLWQTPRDQRAYLTDLPVFDAGRDGRWPEGRETPTPQHWALAVAAERAELGRPVQRVLVVGSNGWFIDAVTQQQLTGADGRPVLRNPGNLELFEAGVAWLARQDDLIAQSPAARAASLVRDINPAALTRLRLAMVLGLPGFVLLMGAGYRLIRR